MERQEIDKIYGELATEIDTLSNTTIDYISNKPAGTDPIRRFIYGSYNSLAKRRKYLTKLELDDIRQEVSWLFYRKIPAYHNGPLPFKEQILRMVTFYMKEWLYKQSVKYKADTKGCPVSNPEEFAEMDLGPSFVVRGTLVHPYNTLSNIDRYILHKVYYEDLSGRQLADLLNKDQTGMYKRIHSILDHLRREFNGT